MAVLLRRTALGLLRRRRPSPPPPSPPPAAAAAAPWPTSPRQQHLPSRSFRATAAAQGGDASMKDEYGAMDASGSTFVFEGDFELEAGGVLRDPQVKYRTWGKLNAAWDNCLWCATR